MSQKRVVIRRTARVLSRAGMIAASAAGVLAAFVHFAPPPRYAVRPPDLRVTVTPERVAEGRRIVTMVCASCHADPATGRLSGRKVGLPPQFGTFYSANITRDRAFGIGGYTDGELAWLLRTGVKRDGHMAAPMPVLAGIADDDVASIVAFLRSDDPSVAPHPVRPPPSRPGLLAKGYMRFVLEPQPWKDGPATAPTHDPVAFGRYLTASRYDCQGCHTPSLAGGQEMGRVDGRVVVSANLTPDPETGLPGLTVEHLDRVLRKGFRPGNRPVRPPMPLFDRMTDREVEALYAYLRTLPPVRRPRPDPEAVPVAAQPHPGRRIYAKYSCQACHGETGQGSCDLRGAARRFPTDAELIAFVRNPAATVPGSRMPGWEGVIEPDDYAPLAAYVRQLGLAAPARVASQ